MEKEIRDSVADLDTGESSDVYGPVKVARWFVTDSNGKKREMVRTRNGREIPIATDEEAEEWLRTHPYED